MRALLSVAWFGLLLAFELRRPLRRRREPEVVRIPRNLAVAAAAAASIKLTEAPLARALSEWVERRQVGLVFLLPMRLRSLTAIILMDYTLYLWHVLTHRVPLLWRFHQVHHLDLDLDTSTAIRFHFGELAISSLFRAAQILVIGTAPRALSAWQTFLMISILFHHSNVRIPLRWERILAHLVVTPRLHGIHHSVLPDEVNSNWSSGLTIWDWLHKTLRTDVPQQAITVGVPGQTNPELSHILLLPFRHPAPASVSVTTSQRHVASGHRNPIAALTV